MTQQNFTVDNGLTVTGTGGNITGATNIEASGNITANVFVGNTANNSGSMQWVGNSSGDGYGYTTLEIRPDDTLTGDQWLVIDPTSPNHIHIRAGGAQDNSNAYLFLGGENSYFQVPAGSNTNVYVTANSSQWIFGADSVLTLPGEGVVRSNNDTIILESYDTGNSIGRGLRVGTSGQLFLEQTGSPAWLTFSNDSGDAEIGAAPGAVGTGNAGFNLYLFGGPADTNAYGTGTGGNINLQAGLGATNDGGGGGQGGSINITAGNSYDPAGVPGNINIETGNYTWTYGYNGELWLPGGTGYITSEANSIAMYSNEAETNGMLFYETGSEVYSVGDFKIFSDNSNASYTWNFYANATMSAPGNISAAGNITADNFIGNISLTGNVTGTSSNVTLVAGSYSTVFDNTGVATFPGNISTTGNILATGVFSTTGNVNATGLQVGNGAVSNCAVAMKPTAGTAGNYAIRDYSTANSVMYFDTTIGSANIGGAFTFRGSNAFTQYATINQYGVSQPTLPAFRVYGSSSNNIPVGTLTSTQGATIDYNQGSYYNNTTGLFTAPVAGIYSATATLRVGSTSGLNQASIQKNSSNSGANVVAFWEVAGNSSSNGFGHMSMAGTAKLAVGDTLRLQVLSGNINFDSNDSWSVTFIG